VTNYGSPSSSSSITSNSSKSNPFYKDNGWKAGLPWLYYQRSSGEVLNEAKRVKQRVSFGYENQRIGIVNKLTYQLARFDLLGNFYGFETLSDQLLLC
jgi:Meckelin (Transmembrane protein 67)